ncbi:MAG TPA: cytochrome c [Stellaceae bacterium]|nr:cytochrome c [Stellaceae bacterium]
MAAAVAVLSLAKAKADEDAIKHGAYLAAAAGCDNCHTDSKNGGAPYAGGRVLAGEFGAIPAPNITPDIATGIGGWSDADFIRAMRWGIAPDGTHYVPAFPFPYFARLSDDDLADLKVYLDSLKPVSHLVAAPHSLALFARARAAIGTAIAGTWTSPPALSSTSGPIARGAYLVATVGRCGDCHTPLTWLGAPDLDRFLGGSSGGLEGRKAPDITSDPRYGIGHWSEDDIAKALKDGETPDFDFLGGAMAEIVRNTARLTDDDRRAVAAYLKTVPPNVLEKR